MATATGPAPAVGLRLPRARRLLAVHPEWWVYAVAAGAALVLLTGALGATHPLGHHTATGAHHPLASMGAGALASAWSSGWDHWILMVPAMMFPVVAPQVRLVALRSVWTRRHRSAVVFVGGYVAVWLGLGAVLVAAVVVLGLPRWSGLWLPVVLAGAAGWQVAGPRRRALRRCAALRLGAATGVAADADCARAGARSGLRCAVTCGPLVLAMAVSPSVVLMVGLVVVMLGERRRGPDPVRRAGRPREAWVLAGFAVVAALAGLAG